MEPNHEKPSAPSLNHKDWYRKPNDYLVQSVMPIFIPCLGHAVQVWIDLESDQQWWTGRQAASLEALLQLPSEMAQHCGVALHAAARKYRRKRRIAPYLFHGLQQDIIWEKSQVIIPQHYDTPHQYVLFLPETRWPLVDSEYTLELEFLFSDGEIELVQEMSGLWTRTEWFSYYLKR